MGRETKEGSFKGTINIELMWHFIILFTSIAICTSCSKTVIIHGREYERPTREEIKADHDTKVYAKWIRDQRIKQRKGYQRREARRKERRLTHPLPPTFD